MCTVWHQQKLVLRIGLPSKNVHKSLSRDNAIENFLFLRLSLIGNVKKSIQETAFTAEQKCQDRIFVRLWPTCTQSNNLKSRAKMIDETCIWPFSSINQIGEHIQFYQMFSPKTKHLDMRLACTLASSGENKR